MDGRKRVTEQMDQDILHMLMSPRVLIPKKQLEIIWGRIIYHFHYVLRVLVTDHLNVNLSPLPLEILFQDQPELIWLGLI